MSRQQAEVKLAVNVSTADEPQYWWRIMNREEAAPMPFQNLFEEWLLVPEPPSTTEATMETVKRVEEQVRQSAAAEQRENEIWGDDDPPFVDEWFGEGDNFCESKPMQALELEMEMGREQEREERIDRALTWMRSLAVATGLVPA